MQRRHLVIFARMPAIGRVKTRLARDIGAVAAWRFYVATLSHVARRMAGDNRWQTWIAVTPDAAAGSLMPFWPANAKRIGQGTGDLGQRMARVMNALPPGSVIIVGADIPAVTPGRVWRAFSLLRRTDVVFGPANDGGYWLVGTRKGKSTLGRAHRELFASVRWSTCHALADTVRNADARTRIAYADTLSDVDNGRDYRKWRKPT